MLNFFRTAKLVISAKMNNPYLLGFCFLLLLTWYFFTNFALDFEENVQSYG